VLVTSGGNVGRSRHLGDADTQDATRGASCTRTDADKDALAAVGCHKIKISSWNEILTERIEQ